MSDNDLIRRGDAMRIMSDGDDIVGPDYPEWFINRYAAINSIPAKADRAEAALAATMKDKKWIMEERDRTFALMLNRAERAEAEIQVVKKSLTTAEAALAAQIEADAGVDPEKFLELVIYAAKEAREKALRDAVRSLRRRKAVYLLKARKAMRSAGEVQDQDLRSQQWEKCDQMMHTAEAHDYAIADILALIEKEKPNLYGEAE